MYSVPDLQQWQIISACKLSVFFSKLVNYMGKECVSLNGFFALRSTKIQTVSLHFAYTTLTLLSTSKMFCFYFFSCCDLIFFMSIFILIACELATLRDFVVVVVVAHFVDFNNLLKSQSTISLCPSIASLSYNRKRRREKKPSPFSHSQTLSHSVIVL